MEAFKFFIPEKIKKLATAAKITERRMSQRLVLPELNRVFIEPLSKNTNGKRIIAINNESINKRAIGETSVRIF